MKNKFSSTAFTRCGPLIGTCIIVFSFHIFIFLDHPTRFLQGLITPSVIIPMLLLMAIAIMVGYVIGYIPAYITGKLFLQIFGNKLANANLFKVIAYGGFISILWAPIILILMQLSKVNILLFLYLQFIFILPITVICAVMEWKKLAPH